MVFGTFDMLHPGHINFFKQARKVAKQTFLIVSIARDVNVRKIKGRRPRKNEEQRKRMLAESGLADKVVLSNIKNYIGHIKREQPDIIALGYDQTHYTETLQKDLRAANLKTSVVRLRSFRPAIYKTSLMHKKNKA